MSKKRHNNHFIKPEREHMTLPEVEVKKIKEPHPICAICGEQIDAIAEAISEPDGSFSHFDCVIKKLTNQYNVTEPDKVSYIGHGTFGICSLDEEGHYSIKEKIAYESGESFNSMKNYVDGNRNE